MAAKNMEVKGSAAVTCSTCAMFIILPEKVQHYTCSRCKLVTLLEEKIKLLEAQQSASQVIKKDKKLLNKAMQTAVEEQHSGGIPMEIDEYQTQKANPGNGTPSSGAVKKQAAELPGAAQVLPMDVDSRPEQQSQSLQNLVVGQGSANRRIHATSQRRNQRFVAAMTPHKLVPVPRKWVPLRL